MTVSAGSQSVKDKSRTLKAKSNPDAAAVVDASTPLSNPHTSAVAAVDVVIDDSSEAAADSKTAPK
jgi:myb proto-oncogene protein